MVACQQWEVITELCQVRLCHIRLLILIAINVMDQAGILTKTRLAVNVFARSVTELAGTLKKTRHAKR
jgi:hypothetical protein